MRTKEKGQQKRKQVPTKSVAHHPRTLLRWAQRGCQAPCGLRVAQLGPLAQAHVGLSFWAWSDRWDLPWTPRLMLSVGPWLCREKTGASQRPSLLRAAN